MFCYKRKTSFIEYYINGIKSRCVGIVKQKLTAEELWLAIDLYGLEDWKNLSCKVSVGNAEARQPLFDMEVYKGKSAGEYIIPLKSLGQSDYKKLFFSCGNDCYGIADLCELPEKKELSERTVTLKLPDMLKQPITEESEVADKVKMLRESKGPEIEGVVAENAPTESQEIFVEEETELLTDCLEPQPDKWEVIKKKYPILYPFKGQGPYVSIKPVDLQLLDRKYHHLSNNSYLMHAFYEYRHMILGEYAMEQGTFFYVGVPGEFIKKEQNSAAMFGFEGYEHSGDLGYYLYRVEL